MHIRALQAQPPCVIALPAGDIRFFHTPARGYFIRSCKYGFVMVRVYALASSGKQSGAPGASKCSRSHTPRATRRLGADFRGGGGGGGARMVKCSYAN